MKIIRLALASLLMLQLSCYDSRLYEDYADFDQKIWLADSTAQFQFEVDNPDLKYNLYLNIRNTNTYPYHNLYVRYQLQDSTGNELINELVNQNLYNEKTGEPLGSGLGDIYSHQFLLRKDISFSQSGIYHVSLDQYMRQDTLQGIVSAGIRLEKNVSDDGK